MKAIVDQLQDIFRLEQEALAAYRTADPTEYNLLLGQLREHSAVSQINFGMEVRSGPLDDFEQMMFTKLPAAPTVRHLYKVSKYAQDRGDVYLAYVSPKNPPADQFVLLACFAFLARDCKLEAVALYHFDNLNQAEHEWKYTAGDEQMGPESMGIPIGISRLRSPSSPPTATADYLSDK